MDSSKFLNESYLSNLEEDESKLDLKEENLELKNHIKNDIAQIQQQNNNNFSK